jgi:predicted lipoprotein with Yx(FWY)xxD motif
MSGIFDSEPAVRQRAGAAGRPRRTVGRRLSSVVSVAALVGLLLAVAVTVALAAAVTTVKSASNSTLKETVVVNGQGHTLYALSPETTHHLLCTSSECFNHWPPLTVRSAKAKLKAGPGVHGALGILRRSNGTFQVTLRGLPLYRYAEDHAKGDANGEGIESFGGTWHAVTASASATKPAPSKPAPSTPAPTEPSHPGYTY